MKPLTLTIIIAVYNEEACLKNCLEAIKQQKLMPDEVIVVDNNSTDASTKIAKMYSFVKVLHQPTQGLIASRNLGFTNAKSDLLARIDADCTLKPDWVQRVKNSFADSSVDAVAGLALTRTFWQSFVPRTRLWSLIYMWWTEAEFGIPILWGANMVLRRSAWKVIEPQVCMDDTMVHEDQDISFLLAGYGKKIVRNNNLLVTASGDDYHDWEKFKEYVRRRLQTKRLHQKLGTLSRPEAIKIAPINRIFRYIGILIPGIAFILTSPLIFILRLVVPSSPHPARVTEK